jgi:hypothetical protein
MKHTDALGLNGHAVRTIIPKKVNENLTEHDILSLQDAFLINGFHSIHVSNQAVGRTLINNFLDSLPMYTRNACLTLNDTQSLPDTIFDVYTTLYLEGLNEQGIEEFFINEFYFDFVWIECSQELMQALWFAHFNKILEAYAGQMPIIKVYSGETSRD